jgi:sRNA-binding protein
MNYYYPQAYPREMLEEWVGYLVQNYPACFFGDPGQRRPIKKDIQNDLRHETDIDVETAVSYYIRSWGYLYSLRAGVDRIDLDGKKAGVVTEQEAAAAHKQLVDEKQKLYEKRAVERRNSIATLNGLHANGRISTDQLRKVDAPPVPPVPPVRTVLEVKQATGNPWARLESLMGHTAKLMAAGEDRVLQSALVAASLKVLVQEAQRVIASLENGDV